MSDRITVTGLVATPPRHLVTGEGLAITSFRLASSQRRFDRGREEWVDGETNWYTVTGFRRLAMHAAASLSKGDRVLVAGRLRVRDWEQGERNGTTVEVEAEAIGHDLSWGQSRFTRAAASAAESGATAADAAGARGEGAPEAAAAAAPEPLGVEHWPAAAAPAAATVAGGSWPASDLQPDAPRPHEQQQDAPRQDVQQPRAQRQGAGRASASSSAGAKQRALQEAGSAAGDPAA